jgi:hypothetical protein
VDAGLGFVAAVANAKHVTKSKGITDKGGNKYVPKTIIIGFACP